MDSRRLLTFRAVARERSFSRAAQRLSLSQPSVSHQVSLLETEVGSRLLERGRGGLRLTATGAVLLEHADQVAWRLELAETQLAELTAVRRRRLAIGAFPTALAGFVPAAVARLRDSDPELGVLLSEVTAGTLEERLLSGEFDVALAYQDAGIERREMTGVQRIDLFADSFRIGLPLDHHLASADRAIALAELAGDDWVVPSEDGFLVDACRDAGFEPNIVAISQDPIATRGLISRGLAVGWVPGLLADGYTGVAIRPVAGPINTRDIYALLPPGDRHPLCARVVEALKATAQGYGEQPVGVDRRRPGG